MKTFELNYVAWDAAILKNDCILVEANPIEMINLIQVAGAPGRRQQYRELVKLQKEIT